MFWRRFPVVERRLPFQPDHLIMAGTARRAPHLSSGEPPGKLPHNEIWQVRMVHRFPQFSDIHFGQEQRDGTRVTHDLVREGAVKDCRQLAQTRGPATAVIVTGDTAYAGKADEYKSATAWLEQLTAACGCNETAVLAIPGNHDCDRGGISYQAKLIHAQLRASTPEVVQAMLHGIAKDGESDNPFLPKLAAYRQFARGYGCDFESSERPLWVREFPLDGKVRLRVMGLTSVQVSDGEDAEGKMILGNRQYTFAEDDNVICVILVHHPLNWFIDKVDASQILCGNARLIMVGHEHLLNIHTTRDELAQREHLVIFSGAINPPERGGEYKFTFNWIELGVREINEVHHLLIRVFPRVWIPQSVRFEADRNRLGGDEYREIVIQCPNVHPEKEDPPTQSLSLAPDEPFAAVDEERHGVPAHGKGGAVPQAACTVQNRSAMDTDNAAFDRLRYLFWRYLDYRQRLKVLVAVDALPETADQQLPQTLERLALEAARKAGKLHRLWDAMMPLVPEEKRSVNPFAPTHE